ncbi:hypothetical protein SAMN05421668_10688 [Halolactibacillus miurensis]|uniref:Uncharacterized protein n=2 Tax=Halolactibacillus miurensis TaxID=306541 RepID=A0A1I6RGM2_9BACI|nr:hypothetical protein SAMN05421668_10688 [Halolactibacillus miurensis]
MMSKKLEMISKIIIIIITLVVISNSVNYTFASSSLTLPPLKPESFRIGLIDSSIGDSSVGTALSKGIRAGDQSIQELSLETNSIPEDIDSVWISKKDLIKANAKHLFKEAKKYKKPFYIYGDGLNIKEVSDALGAEIDLDVRFSSGDKENVNETSNLDMMGYKFENEKIIPSFILSINTEKQLNKEKQQYDLEGLKKHARYYDIKINRERQQKTSSNFLSPTVINAAGMNVNLPSSFKQVYTWDVTVYNWVEVSSGNYKRASTYHVYEVYKDDTPSNPDYKSYATFRLDAVHLDSFQEFHSRNVLYAQNGGVITKNYEPENTSFDGSTSISLGWPVSASLTFNTQDPVDIYNSSIDWQNDKHSFYVNDNELFDTRLRPGDVWVANLGYHIPQNATWHEWGNKMSHKKEGVWSGANPSEYKNKSKSYYRTSGDYVYWRLSR